MRSNPGRGHRVGDQERKDVSHDQDDGLACPHCQRSLRGKDWLASLEHDERGFYLACRHCRKRVNLRDESIHPGPRRWVVVT